MDSTLYRSEGKITAQVDDFPDATDPVGSFVTLSFKQGTGALRMTLPFHMSACAHMIVEAFNAHMDGMVLRNLNGKAVYAKGWHDTEGAIEATPFPTGAATALGLAMVYAADLGMDSKGAYHLSLSSTDPDEQAAHAVERRDLP